MSCKHFGEHLKVSTFYTRELSQDGKILACFSVCQVKHIKVAGFENSALNTNR